MENETPLQLKKFGPALKAWATCLIVTLMLGYGVALIKVYDHSQLDLKKVVAIYRGDELQSDPDSMVVPQSFASVLSVTHVHSMTQPFLFGLLGFVFCFSSMDEKKKATLITIGFAGTVISNCSPWLIKYLAGGFVYLLPLSQLMVAISLLSMSGISLKEMWLTKAE